MTLVDAEHARLVAMCGTWDVEMTFWFKPGGQGLTTKATSTIRSLFDGLFVEEKIEGALNGTPFTTLSWTGFNADTHQYRGHADREHEFQSHRRERRLRRTDETVRVQGGLPVGRRDVASADRHPVHVG